MQQEQLATLPIFRWRSLAIWEAALGCSTVAFIAVFCTFNGVMRGFVRSLFTEGPGTAWPLVFAFVVPVVYEGLRYGLLRAWLKVSAHRPAA